MRVRSKENYERACFATVKEVWPEVEAEGLSDAHVLEICQSDDVSRASLAELGAGVGQGQAGQAQTGSTESTKEFQKACKEIGTGLAFYLASARSEKVTASKGGGTSSGPRAPSAQSGDCWNICKGRPGVDDKNPGKSGGEFTCAACCLPQGGQGVCGYFGRWKWHGIGKWHWRHSCKCNGKLP